MEIQVGQLFVVSGLSSGSGDSYSIEAQIAVRSFQAASGKILRLLAQAGTVAACEVVYDGESGGMSMYERMTGNRGEAKDGKLMVNLAGLEVEAVTESFSQQLRPAPQPLPEPRYPSVSFGSMPGYATLGAPIALAEIQGIKLKHEQGLDKSPEPKKKVATKKPANRKQPKRKS